MPAPFPHRPARLLCLGLALWSATALATDAPSARFRVYSHLLAPEEHPDYLRRPVRPPTWSTFKNQTQFTCLRGFEVQDDQIVRFTEELDKFTRTHHLGAVIWPSYPILFAKNLGDLAREIHQRDLFLFDIWGYVPGSGPGGYWQQFAPPPEVFTLLEQTLGGRWLGTDIGEQDGRYVGGYANQMTPASANHLEQYLNFQRHFERMGDDLGHKHATLVSLNFGHYLIKEGTYTLIGAETAQALPNNQVYYAFIRGAGKQYGVPWFGNASIFNRWGFKTYGTSGKSDGYEHGPSKGTSLSLMKRLLYSHILYNSMAAGFENGWFEGDRLSPIGQIQQAAQEWVNEHRQPGVMHTPVALMVDFFSGWSFPRHLYTDHAYRVWGNLPYDEGDYFTDAILDLVYPGYERASYYRDETGFMTPTPYGDIVDCLLSDAPSWLLERYPVVIVTGRLTPSRETAAKLRTYAEQGGRLAITRENLRNLRRFIDLETATGTVPLGRGWVTILDPGYGVVMQSSPPKIPAAGTLIDQPLPKPYSLPVPVREALHQLLTSQALFQADPRLSLITCRKAPGLYTLGVANNEWHELPLNLTSRCGPITSIRELTLDRSEVSAQGFLPESVTGAKLGTNSDKTIAGGEIRLFSVTVEEQGVETMVHRTPPRAPKGRLLPLRRVDGIKEAILARPTFFQHFDGVVLDWRYAADRHLSALRRESRWLKRQGVRLVVDASSGINLYPTLRLVNNHPTEFAASLATLRDLLQKMEALGATDLLFSLHRHPENNFTDTQTQAGFEDTLRTLAADAARHSITLHLRQTFGKPPWDLGALIALAEQVGSDHLKVAPALSLLGRPLSNEEHDRLRGKVGFFLVSGRRVDIAGRLWDAHAPWADQAEASTAARWIAALDKTPIIFDLAVSDPDSEYLQCTLWTQALQDPAERP